MNRLQRVIDGQKKGLPLGVFSICSANSFVLETCMENARGNNLTLLIEATSNQINQFGGYTGLKPLDFANWIKQLSKKYGVDWENITLGGDHLGPTPWQNKPSAEALSLSEEIVYEYVAAGFQKIHLDASMPLQDDDLQKFDKKLVAKRTVKLALAAEKAADDYENPQRPFYIIGSDVPVAGGMQLSEGNISVSSESDVQEIIEETQKAFYQAGLYNAWERVIAVVVRPGVEFGDQIIFHYRSEKTKGLTKLIEKQPQMIYEAHSTDYQTADNLKQMVKDHFAILKVGPALTFAFREAVFSLAFIENELSQINKINQPSQLVEVLEKTMLEDPSFWIKYYRGNENELKFARKFSLSDRSRYYWTKPQVRNAVQLLLDNLSQQDLPWSLVNQYFPGQDTRAKREKKHTMPKYLISNNINKVIDDYTFACGEGIIL